MTAGSVTIDELLVADEADAWRSAGFTVDDDGRCRVGTVRIRLVGRAEGRGVVAWSLRGFPALGEGELDGVPTTVSDAAPAEPGTHPNGVVRIDHVVLMSPDVERTVRELDRVGLVPRRERDGELGGAAVRQVFYRLGEVILEVVGSPDEAHPGPSRIWGITHVVADLDATVAQLGERTSRPKDAVQPGRRISTLRHREFDISVATALIS